MKRILILSVVACLLLWLLVGCKQQSQEDGIPDDTGEQPDNGETQQFQPGTYTDDAGKVVDITEMPERIVSFGPAITEILFALGLGDKVVGVDDFSDYPEETLEKAKVGNAWSPSIEAVVELEPDLVLTVDSVQFISDLESLGYTYFILDPDDIYGIVENIRLVGNVTGKVIEGEQLASEMEQVVADITEQVEDASRPKVCFVIDATQPNMPWIAGPGSFIDDIINLAGGENIAASAATAWAQLSIEEIVDAEPDIIVVQTMIGGIPTITAEQMGEHVVWQQLTAVQADKVYIIDGDIVSRPGPRIMQGLEEMAGIIHPELFD